MHLGDGCRTDNACQVRCDEADGCLSQSYCDSVSHSSLFTPVPRRRAADSGRGAANVFSSRSEAPEPRRDLRALVFEERQQQTQRPVAVQWVTDIQDALAEAKRSNRNVLVKFGATWCEACQRMNRETMADRDVVEVVWRAFITVSLDVDRNERLARQLQIESVPTVLVMSPTGQVLDRLTGFQTADELLRVIARGSSNRLGRQAAHVTQRLRN